MSLPIYTTNSKDLSLLQTNWASQINPLLSNQITKGYLLTNVELLTGVNTINHLLSRKMVGWMIADIDSAAVIYRTQPFNNKTLVLSTSAPATINLWVF